MDQFLKMLEESTSIVFDIIGKDFTCIRTEYNSSDAEVWVSEKTVDMWFGDTHLMFDLDAFLSAEIDENVYGFKTESTDITIEFYT